MGKVVVIDGAVFIGSNLAEELAASNGVIITGKKESIADLIKRDDVRFTQGSIFDLHLSQSVGRSRARTCNMLLLSLYL